MGQGSEPGVVTTAGFFWTRLRLDDTGITYRNFLRTHRIGWDQVRWFRDGEADARWRLRMVLRDGHAIEFAASARWEGRPEALAAIRQAAARHAVPVVLTGTGLYAIVLSGTTVAAAVMLALFLYEVRQPKANLQWAQSAPMAWLIFGTLPTFVAWALRRGARQHDQAVKATAARSRAQDSTASFPDSRDDDPAAGEPISSPPPAAAMAMPVSCRECGADNAQATRICPRCGAPLSTLSGT
jgi:hypothetical protein